MLKETTMRLRSKINLYTTVMFICLLLLINGAIYVSFSRVTLNRELERTAAEAKQTIKGISVRNTIPTRDLLRAYAPINGMLQIVNADGVQMQLSPLQVTRSLGRYPLHFIKKNNVKLLNMTEFLMLLFRSLLFGPAAWIADLQVTENLALAANNLQIT